MSNYSQAYSYQAGEERLSDSTVIPEGWYKAKISNMENKASANQETGGGMVNLTFEIIGGQYGGSNLYDNLLLWDTREKSVAMTRRKLNTLCFAVGIPGFTDLNELMNKPMYIKVATQEERTILDENTGENKKYAARSQIKNFRSIAEHEGSPDAGQPAQVPQVTNANTGGGFPGAQQNQPIQQQVQQPQTTQAPAQTQAPQTQQAQQTSAPQADQSNLPPWERK